MDLHIRHLGEQPYVPIWKSMRAFTDQRTETTPDECWLLEHSPIFTQGQAGKPEHILNAHHIPVVQSDRGGQVTYHGPGQIIIYLLLDLKRREQGIRHLVCDLEKAIIQFLGDYAIVGHHQEGAPGVYVSGKKIASIGLRVRKGCTYHGISFNFDMDLTPFRYINPCGYADLSMTQFSDFVPHANKADIEKNLIAHLTKQLAYTPIIRGLYEAA